MKKRYWIVAVIALAATPLAVASVGCKSSSSNKGTATRTPARTTPAGTGIYQTPTSGTPTTTSGATGATLKVTQNASLGGILTDAFGRALYKYASDQANVSNCTAACAQVWPPLTISGGTPTAGTSVTGQLGTIQRADGTTQVTLDGSPLYYFASDTAAGDAKGDGVGGFSLIKTGG